jgi:CheY-like chemotaxis protein
VPVPKRILIVDDETGVLFVLRRALERLTPRCQVETYSRGLEALEMATRMHFDLVITDLKMPDMDGVALTEALSALRDAPAVIWMTAYGCRATAQEAARLGVHRCLDKPLEVADIRHVVSETLGGLA